VGEDVSTVLGVDVLEPGVTDGTVTPWSFMQLR
jgi:hypothetical protein